MAKNDETIKEIALSIQHHRHLETKELKGPYKNLAIGLSIVHFFGEDRKIWITPNENLGGHIIVKDIVGDATGIKHVGSTTVVSDGKVVAKNSKVGELLIRHSNGKHVVHTKKGPQDITIYNLTSYIPNPHSSQAQDVQIKLGEPKPRVYRLLSELLSIINRSDEKIQDLIDEKAILQEKVERQSEIEREVEELARRIEEEQRRRENALAEVKSFIRKNAELRYQPILDPWQEEVKRSVIFNGTIAIDGGPGTGKTTSLIQRIKFLIDREAMLGKQSADEEFIDEGYLPNMTEGQKQIVFESPRNWVFFTPNELLKLFLRNSMIQEGLIADDERVLIWKEYLTKLIKEYLLVNPDTQNPFLFLRKRLSESIYPVSVDELKVILQGFEDFFLAVLNGKLSAIRSMNVENFSWTMQGKFIQNYINRQEEYYSIEGIVRLYLNLQELFSQEVNRLNQSFQDLLRKAAARVIQNMNHDPEFATAINSYAQDWISTSRSVPEDDIDDEEEEEILVKDLEAFIYGKLKTLIKNLALAKLDTTVRISSRFQEFNNVIKERLNIEEFESFEQIGQLAYFNKYFIKITRGVSVNVLSEIPKAYKAYRKKELSSEGKGWNYSLLEYLVVDESSRNKRLHPEEQAFLIYFINELLKKVGKVSRLISERNNHPYFEALRRHAVPVIAVDEATDFHVVDLLAIHSLSHPEISSVTYSGDIMQRLTTTGIRNWNDIAGFLSSFEIKQLRVSYRQSPTLLEIASELYSIATEQEAEYISFMDKDPKEPMPLYFRSDNEHEKIRWIGDRILEIYRAYGIQNFPSIAVFLPIDDDVEKFAEQLRELDDLADVGILVRASKDGKVLDDKNMVRVFPIDYIKGLEFEAVFFHNLHLLDAKYSSPEMIMKNLYVGLSRASFYMGITTNVDVPKYDFLTKYFQTNNLAWK